MAAQIVIKIDGKNSADAAFKDAQRGLHDLDNTARKSGDGFDTLKNVGVAALGAIAGAAVAAAGAVAAFVADSVAKTADFEGQMSGVQAILGATPDQARALTDAAIEMGQETKFSATESASAFEMLAQNGLSATQILSGAGRATADLAAATGGDMTTAADVASTAMLLFNKTGEEMGDVIDGVTGVTIAGKYDINDYRLALAQGGGAAASFGVSLEDFNTTIAATSEYFGSGSDAGTAFKTFLTRLVPASGPAAEAMYELGIITEDGTNRFFDANGQMKDMNQIAAVLAEGTAKLTEEQKINALQTAFGSDAMRMAIGIATTGPAAYDALAVSIDNVSASDQAAIRMDNFAGSLEMAKGAVESLQLTIGMALTPILKDLLDNTVMPAIDGLQQLADAAIASGDPIGFLGQKIMEFIGTVAAQLPTQLATWAEQLGKWVLDALPGMGTNLATLYQTLLTWFGTSLPGIVANLAVWGQRFSDWIVAALPVFLQELGNFFASMLAFFVAHAPEILATLAQWTAQFVSWALDTSVKLIVELGVLFGKFLAWIIQKAPELGAKMQEWTTAFVKWITESWPKWTTELGALWGKLTGWIGETAGKLSSDGSIGKALIDGIKSGIASALGGLIDAARNAVARAVQAARAALPGGGGGAPATGGRRAGGGFAHGVTNFAGGLALVGEDGPELVRLPRGSDVIPNARTVSNSYTYNYAPTYQGAPPSPVTDFGLMRTLAGVS